MSRIVDIIVFNRSQSKGFIIDPTVRMEGDCDQAIAIDIENRQIYEPYVEDKYKVLNILVLVALFPKMFVNFLKDFKTPFL